MVEYPVNITFKTDRLSLQKTKKEVEKKVGTQKVRTQTLRERDSREGQTRSGGGGGLAAGLIVGALLSPLKGIVSGIGTMTKGITKLTKIVPIITGLLKPFLALFLLVGFLLLRALGGGTPEERSQKATEGLGIGAGGIGGAALGGPIGAVIGAALSFVAIELTKTFAEWLGKLTADLHNLSVELSERFLDWINDLTGDRLFEISDNIIEIFSLLWDNFQALLSLDFGRIWENMKELGPLLYETLKLILEASFEVLEGIGEWMWELLVGLFTSTFEVLEGIGEWIWELLVGIFTSTFEVLKGIGQWIWDSMTDILRSSFDVLSGIGSWIRDQIQSAVGSIGSGIRSAASFVPGINDGIITPQGDVIRTNPRDYIMASRNPQDLPGGSSRGESSPNITININGNVDNNVYEKMKRELARDFGGRMRF